jgi:hypothetical protein
MGRLLVKKGDPKMDQRDRELLDKELWGFSYNRPKNTAIIGLTVVVMFLAGMTIGSVLFANDSKQVAYNEMVAISIENGVLPVVR